MNIVVEIANSIVRGEYIVRHDSLPTRVLMREKRYLAPLPDTTGFPEIDQNDLNFFFLNLPQPVFAFFVMAQAKDDVWRMNLPDEHRYFQNAGAYEFGLIDMHDNFNEHWTDTYVIEVCGIQFPWNDIVLPLFFKSQRKEVMRNPKPKYFLWDYADKTELLNLLTSITDERPLDQYFGASGLHVINDFVLDTLIFAPSVNGTACVGKTTLLRNSLNQIQSTIDKNAFIIKSGNLGTFAGKDNCQLIALTQQMTNQLANQVAYTSIADRDPFNNAIWRLVQYKFDRPNISSGLIEALSFLDPQTVMFMRQVPTIFIIDTDTRANRARMAARATQGDEWRCKVKNYVLHQNVVYAAMAFLFGKPLFNRACPSAPASFSKIEDLLVEKVKHNAHLMRTNPTIKMHPPHGTYSEIVIDDSCDYEFAKKLTLYK